MFDLSQSHCMLLYAPCCAAKGTSFDLRHITAQQECLSVQGIVGNDLLGSMLAAVDDETKETMTNEQLVDESITFLLAGQWHGWSACF